MAEQADTNEFARTAEFSEARAYAALVRGAGLNGFTVTEVDGAVLLIAPAVPGALILNESLARIAAIYAAAALGFGIELTPAAATPAGLAALKSRQMRKLSTSQVLIRNGEAPPPRYDAWVRATGLRVESVGLELAAELAGLCCENFNMRQEVGALIERGACGAGWRRWLAFDGDRAVGGSLSYVEDGVGWLGWTSVLPSHRGRWVHAGIVARQLEEAASAGCRWVTTETARSTPERPDAAYFNLRKFGFQDAYLRPTYVKAPPRAGS
jgi:GNAT superfamily N-acetyltransferase